MWEGKNKRKKNSLHALCGLASNVDNLLDVKTAFVYVDVLVEAGALAPLGYNRQPRLRYAAHKEENVGVASLPIAAQK